MIISRTPFRVSFFGGGTDFPGFYAEHGGSVLLTSIDKYCYITIHELGPFFKYRFRASYAKTELVQEPNEFKHPLIRETLKHLGVSEGMEISHVSDLPGRTGLGTSSSFTVGLLHALYNYLDEPVTPEQLAREAILIEREKVGDAGGHQDQYAAAYGGLCRLNFSGKDTVDVQRLDIEHDRVKRLEDHLILFYTGVEQSAEELMAAQTKNIGKNEKSLMEMMEMVDRAQSILEGSGDLDEFGMLLHETWIRKKTLSKGITNPLIDEAYEAAREEGALGGKLLGAGGRGFLLVYMRPENHDAIRERLADLQEVRFGFSPIGSEIIFRTPA